MSANSGQVIVTTESIPPLSVNGVSVHHRDFPEVSAHASSPAECAEQLISLLSRTLDNAPSDFQRTMVEHALDDIRAFIDEGAGGPAEERACSTVYVDASSA